MVKKFNRQKILGERIRMLRMERQMTQAQLAYSINKDQQSIQRMESGRVNPTFEFLYQISVGLDISLSELLDIPFL